ncbi:MAG: helix-turn-helix transcriptional regulator [Paludibacteraceae bacterium]|nr:helix-turn-helix transcriptional regulator [Paludibacteraceae bacterium]
MNESERINALMVAEKMNAKQFAEEIGIQTGTLSNILGERNKPSLDVMRKILNRFREVSSDWLILGVGMMFSQKNDSRELYQEQTLFENIDEQDITGDMSGINSESGLPLEGGNVNAELSGGGSSDFSVSKSRLARTRVGDSKVSGISNNSNVRSTEDKKIKPRKIQRIIVYFDDGTFQEFT